MTKHFYCPQALEATINYVAKHNLAFKNQHEYP